VPKKNEKIGSNKYLHLAIAVIIVVLFTCPLLAQGFFDSFRDTTDNSFDLRAVKVDSSELIFKNLNLCKMLIVTLLYEFNEPVFVQDLILENQTDLTFSEIYIRDLSTSFWGMNVLGANVLTPHEKAIISVKPGHEKVCHYEIKGVLLNGQEIIYNNINICNESHILLFRYQGKPYFSFD
jgi:hypothetical protein